LKQQRLEEKLEVNHLQKMLKRTLKKKNQVLKNLKSLKRSVLKKKKKRGLLEKNGISLMMKQDILDRVKIFSKSHALKCKIL
jgi:hypothetical protein